MILGSRPGQCVQADESKSVAFGPNGFPNVESPDEGESAVAIELARDIAACIEFECRADFGEIGKDRVIGGDIVQVPAEDGIVIIPHAGLGDGTGSVDKIILGYGEHQCQAQQQPAGAGR